MYKKLFLVALIVLMAKFRLKIRFTPNNLRVTVEFQKSIGYIFNAMTVEEIILEATKNSSQDWIRYPIDFPSFSQLLKELGSQTVYCKIKINGKLHEGIKLKGHSGYIYVYPVHENGE